MELLTWNTAELIKQPFRWRGTEVGETYEFGSSLVQHSREGNFSNLPDTLYWFLTDSEVCVSLERSLRGLYTPPIPIKKSPYEEYWTPWELATLDQEERATAIGKFLKGDIPREFWTRFLETQGHNSGEDIPRARIAALAQSDFTIEMDTQHSLTPSSPLPHSALKFIRLLQDLSNPVVRPPALNKTIYALDSSSSAFSALRVNVRALKLLWDFIRFRSGHYPLSTIQNHLFKESLLRRGIRCCLKVFQSTTLSCSCLPE